MSTAPKLIKFKINETYFVKNHEIPLNYFNEFKTQRPWKQPLPCTYEDCISYLGEPDAA